MQKQPELLYMLLSELMLLDWQMFILNVPFVSQWHTFVLVSLVCITLCDVVSPDTEWVVTAFIIILYVEMLVKIEWNGL